MGLVTLGGVLARAAGRLVSKCGCCVSYWCVPDGPPNACGVQQYKCDRSRVASVSGPYSTPDCDGQCPDAPPCCEDNDDCPEGFCCIDGVCEPCDEPPPPPPPQSYYCCYENSLDPANRTARCRLGPCTELDDKGNEVPAPHLQASGPHATAQECSEWCRRHNCDPLPCCNGVDCVPAQTGAYATKQECLDRCKPPPDPNLCVLTGPNGVGGQLHSGVTGVSSTFFTINCEPNTPICVRYVSKKSHPIRVIIWSQQLAADGTCRPIAQRVAKIDSGWRGIECCDCDARRNLGGPLVGGPAGELNWVTKQRGITAFEVEVRAPCADSEWDIYVSCQPCSSLVDPVPCDCPDGAVCSGTITGALTVCQVRPVIGTITNTTQAKKLLTINGQPPFGGVDDEVLINGAIYQPGQFPFPWSLYGNPCGSVTGDNGGHNFTYIAILNPGQSITVGARDRGFGGGLTCGWTLECYEQPP